jgi:hypothetical protein
MVQSFPLALAVACVLSQGKPDARAGAPARRIEPLTAIGDVHGDFQTLRALLRSVGLIDESDRWSGGSRRLVQVGDILDRGAESRKVLDLLMRLEEEARASGGKVTALLGNHEAMNLFGDLRYTSLQEFRAFAAEETPEDRARGRRRIEKLIAEGSPLLFSSCYRKIGINLGPKDFDRYFPPGFFAHRAAFSPAGRYGKWLLSRNAVHLEEKTIFLHGGLSARHGMVSIDELNRRIRGGLVAYLEAVAELERLGVYDAALGFGVLRFILDAEKLAGGPHPTLAPIFEKLDELFSGVLFAEDGPLWYRGLAEGNETVLSRTVGRILAFHDAQRIVIGHTQPASLRIEARFGNRVILIDTGMNQAFYGGRPSALLFAADGTLRVAE